MQSDLMTWVKLVMELGMAVWQAIESGQTEQTVDDILRGRRKDMDKIRELHAAAQAHYGKMAEVTVAAPKFDATMAIRVLKRESIQKHLSHEERAEIRGLVTALESL